MILNEEEWNQLLKILEESPKASPKLKEAISKTFSKYPKTIPAEEWRRVGAQEERNQIVIWLRDFGEKYLNETSDTFFAKDPITKIVLAIQSLKHKDSKNDN